MSVNFPDNNSFQYQTEISWLSYVQANAKTGTGENFKNLGELASRIPFQDPIPLEIQRVIDGVKKAAESKFFNPDLLNEASIALQSLQSRAS